MELTGISETEKNQGKGRGKNPRRVVLTHHTFISSTIFSLYLIPLTWVLPARSYTRAHVPLALNLVGLPVGLSCAPHSPPSMPHMAVWMLQRGWEELESVLNNLFIFVLSQPMVKLINYALGSSQEILKLSAANLLLFFWSSVNCPICVKQVASETLGACRHIRHIK